MDWQFLVGIGLAVIFGFLVYAVKEMPKWIAWPGVAVGILLIAWGVIEHIPMGDNPAQSNTIKETNDLTKLDEFIGSVDEVDIRALFDFPDVIKYNILVAKPQEYPNAVPDAVRTSVSSIFGDGNAIMRTSYLKEEEINGKMWLNRIPRNILLIKRDYTILSIQRRCRARL